MSFMENGVLKILTEENLQKLKEQRIFLSDSDSNIICLLIDKVFEQQKEIERLKKDIKDIMTGYEDWGIAFDYEPEFKTDKQK